MLTIKSDDVVGRAKAFEAIVKGADIPTPRIPESFKVLIKELAALCLNITPIGAMIGPQQLTHIPEIKSLQEEKLEETIEKQVKEFKKETKI